MKWDFIGWIVKHNSTNFFATHKLFRQSFYNDFWRICQQEIKCDFFGSGHFSLPFGISHFNSAKQFVTFCFGYCYDLVYGTKSRMLVLLSYHCSSNDYCIKIFSRITKLVKYVAFSQCNFRERDSYLGRECSAAIWRRIPFLVSSMMMEKSWL